MFPWVAAAVLTALGVAFCTAYARLASVAFRGDPLTLLKAVLCSPSDVFERRAAAFYTANSVDNATTTRALGTGRIMLLSFEPTADGASVKALGEGGHVYVIRFGPVPSCSCPAFVYKRTAQCKHLAWFKTKVLGVPPNHYLVTQTAYLRLELAYLLRLPHTNQSQLFAPRPIREALGVEAASSSASDDAMCAICYDELDSASASAVRCRATCRKPFHGSCVTDYLEHLARDGKAAICACCRSPWVASITVQTVVLRDGVATQLVTHPHGPTPRKRRGSVKAL